MNSRPFTAAAKAQPYVVPSQKELVLRHLLLGMTITPMQALSNYGAYRLGSIIHRLRNEGYNITTEINRDPVGRNYAKYKLLRNAA